MIKKVDLACTVCTEEFLVPIGVYNAHSSVIPCPCCGSTDLVLLGEVAGNGPPALTRYLTSSSTAPSMSPPHSGWRGPCS